MANNKRVAVSNFAGEIAHAIQVYSAAMFQYEAKLTAVRARQAGAVDARATYGAAAAASPQVASARARGESLPLSPTVAARMLYVAGASGAGAAAATPPRTATDVYAFARDAASSGTVAVARVHGYLATPDGPGAPFTFERLFAAFHHLHSAGTHVSSPVDRDAPAARGTARPGRAPSVATLESGALPAAGGGGGGSGGSGSAGAAAEAAAAAAAAAARDGAFAAARAARQAAAPRRAVSPRVVGAGREWSVASSVHVHGLLVPVLRAFTAHGRRAAGAQSASTFAAGPAMLLGRAGKRAGARADAGVGAGAGAGGAPAAAAAAGAVLATSVAHAAEAAVLYLHPRVRAVLSTTPRSQIFFRAPRTELSDRERGERRDLLQKSAAAYVLCFAARAAASGVVDDVPAAAPLSKKRRRAAPELM